LRRSFSQFFKLNKVQAELDFVDVYINDDTPLFIDPYVFKVRNDTWSIECNNLIVDFFNTVVQAIRNNGSVYAKKLLKQLNEPKETHLGVSSASVSGKGVSGKQADDLYSKLRQSKAVKTGYLKDLSDCELMISGIGFDKISDITTNIIREKLIEYTQAQCELYGITMRSTPSGKIWNPIEKRWLNGNYVSLPVANEKKIILVPKHIVVFKPLLSSQEFYDHVILEYLQAQHLAAMSSLVEILKNGTRRVTKKALKNCPEYHMSKEFIYNFCNKHPDIINRYKEWKGKEAVKIEDINNIDEAYIARNFIQKLQAIKPGEQDASVFHDLSIGILEFLFFPNLTYPEKESEIHSGRKRIDITFHNASLEGFWAVLRTSPKIAASKIMIECKNYKNDISNPELDQISGRLSNLRGWFGIVLSRKFENKDLFVERCKDTAKDGRGIILCLDDDDIIQLLKFIIDEKRNKIDEVLSQKYQLVIS